MSGSLSARRLTSIGCAVVLTLALVSEPLPATSAPPVVPAAAAAAPNPTLAVTSVVTGLNSPWDLTFTPDGSLLYNLKGGGIFARTTAGATRQLSANFADLFVGSETGLMGMVVDPAYASNRYLYTCQGYTGGGTTDIRVIKWQLDTGLTTATRVGSPLVTGIPVSSGRHGGCRLRFDGAGLLYVSTGDAAIGTIPQDRTSLGGKVLRITTSGAPAPGNPFISSGNGRTRLVFTYGHRNVQGLDLRPGTNQMWSVEQGTGRDDEVNRLVAGTNYGYDPIPGYNESVPMTDVQKYPSAKRAIYTTGSSTLALSGGTWLNGQQWGRWNGAFVAAALKSQTVRVLTITGTDTLSKAEPMAVLEGTYGRLRSPLLGPDGALYVSTSNGSGDRILKITASASGGDAACRTSRQPIPTTVGAATTTAGTRLYVVGTNRGVYYRADTGAAPFAYLAGGTRYGVTATSWDNKRTDVFITGTNGNLYQRYNTGSAWNASWVNLGGQLTSSPSVISFGPRSLAVFARSTSGSLMMKRFTGAAWTGWVSLGGSLTAAPNAAVDRAAGLARVGVRATDGTYRYLGVRADGTRTGGFTNTNIAICSAPALAFRTGAADKFPFSYVDSANRVVVSTGGGTISIGGTITGSTATIATGATGFAIFGRGPGNALYRYDARGAGGSWVSLGGTIQ